MAKEEKNLSVVSFSLTDSSGAEIPAVALVAAPARPCASTSPGSASSQPTSSGTTARPTLQ